MRIAKCLALTVALAVIVTLTAEGQQCSTRGFNYLYGSGEPQSTSQN